MKFLKEETFQFEKKLCSKKFPRARLGLDYVFFEETDYRGWPSHRKAALEFIKVKNDERGVPGILYTDVRYFDDLPIICSPIKLIYAVNPELMYGKQMEVDAFFSVEKADKNNYVSGYAQTFLCSMYSNIGDEADFIFWNDVVLPDKTALTIYKWNDNWSNYFSAGREWMGTFFWTISDTTSNKLIVIGCSLTD
ncbi:hypothetical protein C6P52_07780 [Enterococcus mundtii]|uniref:hypothetical protein n=1 Tax=Enterococcus mundtii TaxID=53346 RepID=UPI000D35F155|nr:hypothetical protein [Enterococcus mundtii]PTO38765.1 hypothetical protein C6P52_07780 [Enterococcus mundtii]PTO43592.1 hypothetical protein C6P54_09380 [Enterococcus mundtii]